MKKNNGIKNQNLLNILNLLKFPLNTDKATKLTQINKYSFIFDKRANKFTIKKIIEYIFNVKVINVNTLKNPMKKKKIGRFLGYKSNYKKAIITLKNGEFINLFPEM